MIHALLKIIRKPLFLVGYIVGRFTRNRKVSS